jgi:Ca-activated chloride channel family protein
MGVGLDYNENLMVGLSENGGGNYYFIESSRDLAAILRREFAATSSIIAQNTSIDLHLGEGVHVCDVIGTDYRTEGSRCIIPVGDIAACDRREFTVELSLPPSRGSRTIAWGSLRQAADDREEVISNTFTSIVHFTTEAAEIERNRDWETQAKSDVALSTRSVDRAMQSLDAGRKDEAAAALNQARTFIASSPAIQQGGAPTALLREQEQRLTRFLDTMRDEKGNPSRAKKSIQFENYVTQKKVQ